MNKMMLPALAAVFAAASAASFAEEGKGPEGHHKGQRFEMMDTNSDGSVTKEEFLAAHEKRFSEMDADKDGKVTKEEGKAHFESMRAKHKEMREKRMEMHKKGK